MIHVITAVNCEARPLKDLESDDLEIITGGVGKVNAAFAVGRVFPRPLTRADLLSDAVVNIGICCSKDKEGLFLVNKITDSTTGRDFYPDIIRVSGLPECSLISSDDTVTDPETGFLYDMEASSIFEASSKLISPDRIIVMKIVSDHGDTSELTSEKISDLIYGHIVEIRRAIDMLKESLQSSGSSNKLCCDQLYSDLRATASMRVQIDELLRFSESLGIDGRELFEEAIRNTGEEKLSKERSKEVILSVRHKLTSI